MKGHDGVTAMLSMRRQSLMRTARQMRAEPVTCSMGDRSQVNDLDVIDFARTG